MDAAALNLINIQSGAPRSRQNNSSQAAFGSPADPPQAPKTERLAEDRVSLNRTRQDVLREEGQKAARELSAQDKQQISQLAARDAEVKAHERAHKAVGGQYTGAISYVYQVGPDGKRYAIGGEVPIDASPVSGDPEATIEKMNVVKAAALAPSDPSAQDRRVASQASQAIAEARAQIAEQSVEQRGEQSESRSEAAEEAPGVNRQAVQTYEQVDNLVSEPSGKQGGLIAQA